MPRLEILSGKEAGKTFDLAGDEMAEVGTSRRAGVCRQTSSPAS